MFKHTTPKKIVGLAIATAVLATAGVAWAYWTTTGSGDGTATTAAANGTLTLHATADSSLLYPGGTADISITAENTSTGTSLKVTTVSFDSLSVDTAHATAGCLASDYTVGTVSTTPTVVAPGETSGVVATATLSMANSALDQDACKGAVVTLNFTSI